MRLALSLPSEWVVQESQEHSSATLLISGRQAIRISFGPLVLRPDEPQPFMLQTMRRGLPAGAQLKLGRTIEHTTSAGWPLRLMEAEVLSPENSLIECRLGAFFTFMEHAAAALVQTEERSQLEAGGKAVLQILESGRPDWRGTSLSLFELWDLQQARPLNPQMQRRSMLGTSRDQLTRELARLDAACAVQPTAQNLLHQGQVLLELQRPEQALQAFRTGITIGGDIASLHDHAGLALGALGRHSEAIQEWQAALALSPTSVELQYNIAQAHFNLLQLDKALAGWRAVCAVASDDIRSHSKVIQCLNALGRYDEATVAREQLRRVWSQSSNPQVSLIEEYVIDQFAVDDFIVHAVETLRPTDQFVQSLLTFRAIDQAERPLPAAVMIETSEQAKQAKTPYVLALQAGQRHQVIGATSQLPSYPELKSKAVKLLRDALRKY
jgi:tetratricopeptide (TPR) repeat protein